MLMDVLILFLNYETSELFHSIARCILKGHDLPRYTLNVPPDRLSDCQMKKCIFFNLRVMTSSHGKILSTYLEKV
jgi:hypothetical protein